MINDLSSNGKDIKIVKDPHPRILQIKSLRITHKERDEVEAKIYAMDKVQQWEELKFRVNLLHSLFFRLDIPELEKELLRSIRRVFYKVTVLVELLLDTSIAQMLNDGFFFKRLYSNDPRYLHQLFDVIEVIYLRKIKI